MDFEKIGLVLKANERTVLIAVIAYSFVSFLFLFVVFPDFRVIELFTQLILSVGFSISILTFIGVLTAFLKPFEFGDNWYFLLAIVVFATTVGLFSYVNGYVSIGFFTIIPIVIVIALNLAMCKSIKRNKKKQAISPDSPTSSPEP